MDNSDQDELDVFVARVREVASPHVAVLVRKFEELVYYDDYGDIVTDKWEREVERFLSRRLSEELLELLNEGYDRCQLISLAESVIQTVMHPFQFPVADDFDGDTAADFITWAKSCFQRHTWRVDAQPHEEQREGRFVAERDGEALVVQCEFRSTSINERAVRQFLAMKSHVDRGQTVIVTNQLIDEPALDLATSAGLPLLNCSFLDEFLTNYDRDEASRAAGPEQESPAGQEIEATIIAAEELITQIEALKSCVDASELSQLTESAFQSVESLYELLYTSAIQTFVSGLDNGFANGEVGEQLHSELSDVLDEWRRVEGIDADRFESFRQQLHEWSVRHPGALGDYKSLRVAFDETAWSLYLSLYGRVIGVSRRVRAIGRIPGDAER